MQETFSHKMTAPRVPTERVMTPTIFVIFGITGDLASRKLLPALLSAFSKNMLPEKFAIIGFSRRAFSREEFRDFIRQKLNIQPGDFKEEDIKHFLDHMTYEQGLFNEPEAYIKLKEHIDGIDLRWGQCSNKLFHLSVPPNLYENILVNLASSKLSLPCDDGVGWTRVLIEKPFGSDIKTAQALDKLLCKLFKEEQIFRIDHYLAKEALQNIIAFRFSNSLFESVWNSQNIDRVHIKLYERDGVGTRGAYYDTVGSLKDVGQNHMIQMLSLIAMDEPASFDAQNVRKERATIVKRLLPINIRQMSKHVIRGQYDGYINEVGVKGDSQTETYFRIEARLNTKRWRGVPFFLESGKCLNESKTEIDVYIKPQGTQKKSFFFNKPKYTDILGQNVITFRIQPDEGIKLKFFVKKPGRGFETEPKILKFKYTEMQTPSASVPTSHIKNDYERLLYDAFVGDQTLFASTDEILASWKFITPIIENLRKIPLKKYPRGSAGVE